MSGPFADLRAILRTLLHEERSDRRFLARAARAAALSGASGALSGLIPAFVALGVAPLGGGHAPGGGVLTLLAQRLSGTSLFTQVGVSLALVSAAVLLGFAASRSSARFTSDVTVELRAAMMRRVIASSPRQIDRAGAAITGHTAKGPMAAPPGVVAKTPPGAEAVKLAVLRDGQMTAEMVVAVLTNLPQALLALIALIVDVAVSGSPLAAALGCGIFVLSRLLTARASKRISAATGDLARADAGAFGEVGEKIGHLDDLRLAGARREAVLEVDRALVAAGEKRQAMSQAVAASGQIASLVSTLAPLIVLLSLTITGHTVTPPEIARLLLAMPLIVGRLGAVDALRVAALEKRPVLAAVVTLLALPADPAPPKDPVALAALASREIVFDDVSFTPPGAKAPIVDGVSFRIGPGEVVGLCGASGSGKSTLLRLLLRLDDPTGGRITVGGVDLRAIEPEALSRLFGAMTQGGKLLSRTVLENVTLGASEALRALPLAQQRAAVAVALTQSQIPELAGDAGLDKRFVAAPPNLSGGEQRRVLLARALVSEADILVLDEPEAGLPRATARALFDAVLAVRAGRSVVAVTHAPGLLASSKNVVLDKGRRVDEGTHDELVERCALYRTLTAETKASE